MPRVRTAFSAKQLKILKAEFYENPKPNSLKRAHLCEVTGLSTQVIRVWFQNQSCREKKFAKKAIEELQSGLVRDTFDPLNVSINNNHFRVRHLSLH